MNKVKHLAPKPLYANWHSVCRNTETHLWPWHNALREGYREKLSSVNRRGIEKGEREAILKLHEPSFRHFQSGDQHELREQGGIICRLCLPFKAIEQLQHRRHIRW